MTIIRQMQSLFAVPDMRNFGTVSRIVISTVVGILLLPLLSNPSVSYQMAVLEIASWALPTLLVVGITSYFTSHKLAALSYGVPLVLVLNFVKFAVVDYVILGEREHFFQHACIYFTFALFMMYVEANRRQRLSPSLSEARLSALTARIRPHFLFNSLNAAISLIRLRPYDAETLLENLANLFRAQLRDASQSSTLGQEIEWAQEYIAIEQIRMGQTRVQVMWHHNAPDDAETPHLLLQPLLENAVFHGIESTHRPGCIVVQTTLQRHWIYIRIENPYIPPESTENAKPHKGNSMALRNLKERLALMYDNDATVKLQQLDGTFRVDIRLPYRQKAAYSNNPFGN